MKLRGSIFAIGLALALVETLVVASEPFWLIFPVIPHTEAAITALSTGLTVTALLIDPVVVFAAMFVVGRGLDVSADFGSAFFSLLGGTLTGTFGCLIALFGVALTGGLLPIVGPLLVGDLFFDGLGAFRMSLVGFAGLALAHFTLGQRPPIQQAQP